MNDTIRKMKQRKVLILALAFPLFSPLSMQAIQRADNVCMEIQQDKKIVGVKQINPTTVELLFSDNQRMAFDFYGENIFRVFQDVNGGIIRDPEAKPEAQILVDNPRKPVSPLTLKEDNKTISISTKEIRLELDKSTSLLKVTNLATDKVVLEEVKPVLYDKGKTILTLKEKRSLSKTRTAGPMAALPRLPPIIGLPMATALCGTPSNKVNMISVQPKKGQ